MKQSIKFSFITVITLLVLTVTSQVMFAQTDDLSGVPTGGYGRDFVDADGDGYNDNAPDYDGDGIPNGQDTDYLRTGIGNRHGFMDADGDGINDYFQDFDGDGIPNGKDPDYVRPRDGSGRKIRQGYSRQGYLNNWQRGSGACGGTGGSSNRGGRGRGRR